MSNELNDSAKIKPFIVMLVGIVGFMLGIAVILYKSNVTPLSKEFVHMPQSWAWIFLNGAQLTLWAIIALPLMKRLSGLLKYGKHRWGELIITTLLLVIIFLISIEFFYEYCHPKSLPLDNHDLKLLILNLLAAIVTIPLVIGLWLVRMAVIATFKRDNFEAADIDALIRFKRESQNFLTGVGTIIGAATLSFSVLRNAVLAMDYEFSFPSEIVLIWGAFYSILLALVYLPTHIALLAASRKLESVLLEPPSQASESLNSWISGRRAFQEMIGLKAGVWKDYQSILSILAPFAGSAVPVMLRSSIM